MHVVRVNVFRPPDPLKGGITLSGLVWVFYHAFVDIDEAQMARVRDATNQRNSAGQDHAINRQGVDRGGGATAEWSGEKVNRNCTHGVSLGSGPEMNPN